MQSDDLFSRPLDSIVDFRFDEQVARVFPDMLRRSVPGYGTLIALIGVLAARYAQPNTSLYDLGCSLGAATLAMRHHVTEDACKLIAVDCAGAMVERCRALVASDESTVPVQVVEADIRDVTIRNASVVVLNLTLQFVPLADRARLVADIHAGLQPGGVLLLTEKMDFPTAPHDELHQAFKRANGYSDLEISQKRAALENTLLPESLQAHQERLHAAGFSQVHTWFQCLQFVSLLAIR